MIKWPGGKSGEIRHIEGLIPPYRRYIEPFFGGGALYFHLRPPVAAINDASPSLMEYYALIKAQDRELHDLLLCYAESFERLILLCEGEYDRLYALYQQASAGQLQRKGLIGALFPVTQDIVRRLDHVCSERLLLNGEELALYLCRQAADKLLRTAKNNERKPFSDEDLKNNLITGFTSGYYMYMRKIHNDLALGRIEAPSAAYRAANFYFIREYCYGSMFRYNADGEFNIPYGGVSYNKKNLRAKIEHMFRPDVAALFANTDIYCADFEVFLQGLQLTEEDFLFLDPPYDSDFSAYAGNEFTLADQERLAALLSGIPAKFILIIKRTDFIDALYRGRFNILSFDNRYTYNVRSRNERAAQHLIITNLPTE